MAAPTAQDVLRQVFSAFDQNDWTVFDRRPGLHETRQHLPQLYAAFPDLHHSIETELVEGSLIGCVATLRGTHLGSFMGIAPTGKPVSFMMLLIDRIVDGIIVEHWAIPDFLSLFQQLGVNISPTHDVSPTEAQTAEERP
jgi:predicted ester cyclase